ncbi:MAG TPA: YbgC/FadM family acyl-CoA thioesterase [Burkholderiaceae bacterium]|nr:YbgC/FadM family acyl-CoA thioesterase [Burkholderiaceae bacterium]HNB43845.1 YbgC/FadM family acyl-CoA thioesterase [Burkholderiaceae bacterium]
MSHVAEPLRRSDFRFAHRLRVRWVEVDLQQIVFNGHYLMYFDTAIADYWRALGLPYQASMQQLGGDLYVRKSTVEYHASARYDEQLEVTIRCQHIGNSSIRFVCAIFRAEQLLISGELVYVFADPATQTSRPVPLALREILLGFEAGEEMVEVQVGGWAELGEAAGAIRTEVFVREQQIPADLEWDSADATCLHALAINRLGLPLATGRLLPADEHGAAKLGRMAVIATMRGGQVGRQVLEALIDAARARGDREVVLHAQRSAIGFYLRAGFHARGEAFEEAGIPHQEMVRAC